MKKHKIIEESFNAKYKFHTYDFYWSLEQRTLFKQIDISLEPDAAYLERYKMKRRCKISIGAWDIVPKDMVWNKLASWCLGGVSRKWGNNKK